MYDSAREAFIAKKHQMTMDYIKSFSLMDEVCEALRYIILSQSELQSSSCNTTADSVDNVGESVSLDLPSFQNVSLFAENN